MAKLSHRSSGGAKYRPTHATAATTLSMMDVLIRPEAPSDITAIRNVNMQAFGREDEALIVEALRRSPAFLPHLSLVLDQNGTIFAHGLFSVVQVRDGGAVAELLGLGPVAVLPEWQRQGYGSRLIRAGLEFAAADSYRGVVVLGHPTYYPRFGFAPAGRFGLRLPFAVRDEAFMALPLRAGGLDRIAGTVTYDPAFFEAASGSKAAP